MQRPGGLTVAPVLALTFQRVAWDSTSESTALQATGAFELELELA
jgi:hypothetical protein